jgi:peptidoglycan-associated lipoprotein
MRKKVCLSVALGVIFIVVLFAASCSKQVAQIQPVLAPMAEMEVQEATDRPAGETGQAVRLKEDQLQTEAAAREAAENAFVTEYIHFAFNRYVLSDRAQQILKSKADYLRMNPDITITIEGHCDDRGTDIYNLALGERRAVSVKRFLVALGIGTNRLDTISYGEELPIAMGHNEASRARNRRAQFVIN